MVELTVVVLSSCWINCQMLSSGVQIPPYTFENWSSGLESHPNKHTWWSHSSWRLLKTLKIGWEKFISVSWLFEFSLLLHFMFSSYSLSYWALCVITHLTHHVYWHLITHHICHNCYLLIQFDIMVIYFYSQTLNSTTPKHTHKYSIFTTQNTHMAMKIDFVQFIIAQHCYVMAKQNIKPLTTHNIILTRQILNLTLQMK